MLDLTIKNFINLIQSNGLPISIVIFATIKLDKFLSALTQNLTAYNQQLASLEITIIKLTGSLDNLKDRMK